MQKLHSFPDEQRRVIKGVFTDIDDTLTHDGLLPAVAYHAMERLRDGGLMVIPITGRPAGWCDHIARMWPVDGVVGENGAFYFRYDRQNRKMIRRFLQSEEQRREGRSRLDTVRDDILSQVPGAAVASDQFYREADLAIDFCEDVTALGAEDIDKIVAIFNHHGATAKVSSIHVNGWFGTYDKLTMTRLMMAECFGVDLDGEKDFFTFVGDSPNDVPMFEFFAHSVGVANVVDFEHCLEACPAYVTSSRGGAGFAELADLLLR